MKTAIIYSSKHGTTNKVAHEIAGKLDPHQSEIFELERDTISNPVDFDQIIIGGSIHAGSIQKRIKKFCEKHQDILLDKKLGLFLCCAEKEEKAKEQFENAYSAELRQHASATGLLGYEFLLDEMNFFEKAIVKKVAGQTESVHHINHKAIDDFVQEIKTK